MADKLAGGNMLCVDPVVKRFHIYKEFRDCLLSHIARPVYMLATYLMH